MLSDVRVLDLSRPPEIALLDRLLDERQPVSHVFGVREKDVFKFNASSFGPDALQYCEHLDLLAVLSQRGATLEVHDLVSATLPKLQAFLDALEGPFDELVFHFRPDRLGVKATPIETRYDGDVFMVRGQLPFGPEALPEFMVPPPARH